MSAVHVINAIEVPEGMEARAVEVRDHYVAYFRRQPGFLSATFYRALDAGSAFHFIAVVVWESRRAFEAVVDRGFEHPEGENRDGMRVLGRGFPPPIVVHPGRYEVIRDE